MYSLGGEERGERERERERKGGERGGGERGGGGERHHINSIDQSDHTLSSTSSQMTTQNTKPKRPRPTLEMGEAGGCGQSPD